jgi:hypothetical protein
MISAFWFLSCSGLIALVCGIGLAAWIWPLSFRGKGLDLAGIMMLGFGLIALISTDLFELNQTVFSAIPITLALSVLSLACRFFYAGADLKTYLVGVYDSSRKHLLVMVAGIIVGAALVLPSMFPYPGQPFRIGIDQYGYGITSQFLLDGEKIETIKTDLMRETGQDNVPAALLNNNGALNLNLQVSSGFLVRVMRVGYPSMVAAFIKFFGQPLAYPYLFLMLFWPAFFLVNVLWFFFQRVIGATYYKALGYSLAVAMNCNLLNNACEGQHPQWFTAPYIGLLFILMFLQRENSTPADVRNQLPLTAVLGAIIVVLYSDAVLALASVGVSVFIIDLLLQKWNCVAADFRFGLASALGLVLTGPFIVTWIPVIIAQAFMVATGWPGFWQPHWANPAEIMGWIDIYTKPGFRLDPDIFPGHLLGMALSIPLVGINIYYLLHAEKREWAFWISPVLIVMGIFVMTYFVHPIHNYSYMKSYTILFFPIYTLFYVALEKQLSQSKADLWVRRTWLGLLLLTVAVSITTGSIYLVRYYLTAEKLPRDVAELRELDRQVDFEKTVVITPHHFDLRGSILYTSIGMFIPFNWVDCQDLDFYLAPHQGKQILILVMKSEIPPDRIEAISHDPHVIFQNDGFLLLNTGYKLGDIGAPANGSYQCIVPSDARFMPGRTDSQQYAWFKLLQKFGL